MRHLITYFLAKIFKKIIITAKIVHSHRNFQNFIKNNLHILKGYNRWRSIDSPFLLKRHNFCWKFQSWAITFSKFRLWPYAAVYNLASYPRSSMYDAFDLKDKTRLHTPNGLDSNEKLKTPYWKKSNEMDF